LGTDDERRNLTWRNNFSKVKSPNTYVFFAPTDEAFRPFEVTLSDIDKGVANYPDGRVRSSVYIALAKDWWQSQSDPEILGTYAFSFGELLKGTEALLSVPNTDSKYGGWGFNLDSNDGYYNYNCVELDCVPLIKPEQANLIDPQQLKAKPLFKKNTQVLSVFSDLTVDTSILTTANKEMLLANDIPVLTYAAGHRGLPTKNNIDIRERYLQEVPNAPWPRANYEWRHSDFVNVGYPYLHGLFDYWVRIATGGTL
jgi:hypothetical protein